MDWMCLLSEIETLKDMMDRGIIICYNGNEVCVKKIKTPRDNRIWEADMIFDSWDDAFESAKQELKPVVSYQVIVRYNIGLGPQMESIGIVSSRNYDDAKKEAQELLKDFEHLDNVLEFKLRPQSAAHD